MAAGETMSTVPVDGIRTVANAAEHGDAQATQILRAEVQSLKPSELNILTNQMCQRDSLALNGNSCSVERDSNGFVQGIVFTPSLLEHLKGAHSIQADVKGRETIVIAAKDDRPFYAVLGAGAHAASEVAARIDSVTTGAKLLDKEPSTPKELVDGLLAEANRRGTPLGDVVIASHGEPGGIELGNNFYQMDSPDFLAQMARLRGHIANGARIIFDGCNVGANPIGRETMQRLADVTGVTVRGYQFYQIGTSIEGMGPYTEAEPDLMATTFQREYKS